MNNLLSITSNAANRIKTILSNAPDGMDCIIIGIDKSGCSGYSYKLDFGNSSDLKDFEIISQHGTKILIDPKATMFLLGSIMDYREDKLASRFVFDKQGFYEVYQNYSDEFKQQVVSKLKNTYLSDKQDLRARLYQPEGGYSHA